MLLDEVGGKGNSPKGLEAVKTKLNEVSANNENLMESMVSQYADSNTADIKRGILELALKDSSAEWKLMDLAEKGKDDAKELLGEHNKNVEKINSFYKPQIDDNAF